MSPIRQHSNWAVFASLILLAVSVVRVPVADGCFRPLFQLITEAGVFFLFAVFIYFYINKWWGLFLTLTLVSTIFPFFGKWSYMARGAVLVGCIWYVLLVAFVKNPKYLLDALCVIALINVLFANLQYCGFDPYKLATFGLMDSSSGHPTGLMANKNLLSALLAFSLPAFFRKQWVWFAPVVFFGLIIASSTGGVAAVFVMTLVYFFLKDRKDALRRNYWKIGALIVWFCFFTIHIDPPLAIETVKSSDVVEERQPTEVTVTNSLTHRTKTWMKGIELYNQRPLMGYGIGHWKLVFKKMSKPGESVMVQAHNEFIQGLFEMGILFPVILLGYFIAIIRRYRKEAILPVIAVGIIALNSCVNFPFHVATTAIIAVTWMAILEIELRKGNYASRHW